MEKIRFRRKAYEQMLDWKNRLADRYALLARAAHAAPAREPVDAARPRAQPAGGKLLRARNRFRFVHEPECYPQPPLRVNQWLTRSGGSAILNLVSVIEVDVACDVFAVSRKPPTTQIRNSLSNRPSQMKPHPGIRPLRRLSVSFVRAAASVAFLFPFVGFSATEIVDGIEWYYQTNGSSATLDRVDSWTAHISVINTGTTGDIVVPEMLGGLPVKSLGYMCFRDCLKLTSITIPGCVDSIDSGAFWNCKGLSYIKLPKKFKEKSWSQLPSTCSIRFYEKLLVQSTFGQPVPGTGDNSLTTEDAITAFVDQFVMDPTNAKVRYACIGWDGTGSVPVYGKTSSCSFVIMDDSTLTWNWETQVLVSVSIAGDSMSFDWKEWIPKDDMATIDLEPASPLQQIVLSGDSNGVTVSGSTLSIPADQPRNVVVSLIDNGVHLNVQSDLGSCTPAVGQTLWEQNTTINASVASPAPENGLKLHCKGWSGTGSVPSTGTGTNFTFTISENSSLVWNWVTQALISVSVIGGTSEFGSQWIDFGTMAVADIIPDPRYYAVSVFGNTDGVVVNGASLCIPADGPRNIVAVVASVQPETKTEIVDNVEWSFVSFDGKATIRKDGLSSAIPASTAGAVLVPETLGGVPVAEIGEKAFAGCSGVTRLLFTGDAPATVADDAFEGLPEGCTVHVRKGSTGWGNALPGTWHGLPVSDDLLFVEATAAGGGGVSGGGFYAEGDEVSLAAAAETGSVFSHWSGDVAGTEPAKRFEIAEDTTATATFIPESAADRIVADRAETNGYYTVEQLRGLAAGDLLIDLDAATGSARIGVKLEESDDLSDPDSWRPVEFTGADLDVGEDGSVGLRVKTDDNVRFFRLVVP